MMMKRFALVLTTLLAIALSPASRAADDSLITELQQDHVDITSQFTGEQILVFGAIRKGGDVIVKVVSPDQDVALSRKAKVGPVWLDSGNMNVSNAPGLLYLLSTRPLDQILNPAEQQAHKLRLEDALDQAQAPAPTAGMEDWRTAFLRLKTHKGYYLQDGAAVKLDRGRVFSTSINLPAQLPIGTYQLQIYQVRDGKVVSEETRALDVRQVRVERWVSNIAHGYSWAFGIGFTLMAMIIGLVLGIILRRSRND